MKHSESNLQYALLSKFPVQGSSYLLGQRFPACFVLKFSLQRGEGEKREVLHRTFDPS